MHPSLKSRYDKTDCFGAYRKAVVGRIVQRVTNKQLLEHPEQPLCPLFFAIKRTFDLSSINFC